MKRLTMLCIICLQVFVKGSGVNIKWEWNSTCSKNLPIDRHNIWRDEGEEEYLKKKKKIFTENLLLQDHQGEPVTTFETGEQ